MGGGGAPDYFCRDRAPDYVWAPIRRRFSSLFFCVTKQNLETKFYYVHILEVALSIFENTCNYFNATRLEYIAKMLFVEAVHLY